MKKKKRCRRLQSIDKPTSGSFSKDIEKAKELILELKEKYKLTFEELKELLEEELKFPTAIFCKELTVLEAVVKYLKEERGLSLSKISQFIGRDQRNVWGIYNKARKKLPKKFVINKVRLWIPISIFSKKLSALEAVVVYLKDLNLIYHEIAVLLKRDDRTVWTVYQRARKKYGK